MKKLIVVLFSLFALAVTPLSFAQEPPTCVEIGPNLPNCVNPNGIGKITPPNNLPNAGANPSDFIAKLVQNGISLLIIVAFVIAVIWGIINGIRFILANGDEKTVNSAWTQIYWTLIGLVVVLGSFAIIKLVEVFFHVTIFSDTFKLPGLGP